MREIKQNFLIATMVLACTAPAAQAAGVPVLELPAPTESQAVTLSQPGAAFAATPDAQQAALLAPAPPVQPAAAKEPAPSLVPESSNWMMLLVGAGVMLLPRHRRPDNAVR